MNNQDRTRTSYGLIAISAGNPDHNLNDYQTSLGDTLANMMHAAHAFDLDWTRALEIAEMHFSAELNGED